METKKADNTFCCVVSLRGRYEQLREDFQFNLAVLDERDRELERYDFMKEHSRYRQFCGHRQLVKAPPVVIKVSNDCRREHSVLLGFCLTDKKLRMSRTAAPLRFWLPIRGFYL